MISAPAHPLKGNELAWEELIDAPFATKQPVEPAIGCIGLMNAAAAMTDEIEGVEHFGGGLAGWVYDMRLPRWVDRWLYYPV